jgi:hypothetical protein
MSINFSKIPRYEIKKIGTVVLQFLYVGGQTDMVKLIDEFLRLFVANAS